MFESKPPSSAGRKGWSLDTLLGRTAEAAAAPIAPVAAAAVSAPASDLFTRIGGFLKAHRLDPTPVNYDLAYQYLGGHDSALVVAVDSAIARDGLLRPDVAEQISEAATKGLLTPDLKCCSSIWRRVLSRSMPRRVTATAPPEEPGGL